MSFGNDNNFLTDYFFHFDFISFWVIYFFLSDREKEIDFFLDQFKEKKDGEIKENKSVITNGM